MIYLHLDGFVHRVFFIKYFFCRGLGNNDIAEAFKGGGFAAGNQWKTKYIQQVFIRTIYKTFVHFIFISYSAGKIYYPCCLFNFRVFCFQIWRKGETHAATFFDSFFCTEIKIGLKNTVFISMKIIKG